MNRLGAVAALLMLVMVSGLTGCNFFVDQTNTSTGSGGGSGTALGDYVFIVNPNLNTIYVYGIGNNSLNSTGTAYVLPPTFQSTAVTVTRNNNFLYVGGTSGLYGYAIGSGGSLTPLGSANPLSILPVTSLDSSPDGQWLFGLDTASNTIDEYQINSTTGLLTAQASGLFGQLSGTIGNQVLISPKANYVAAALGPAGFVVFPFNTTTGVLSAGKIYGPTASTLGYNALAIDPTDTYLYALQGGATNGAVANGVYGFNLNTLLTTNSGNSIAALAPVGTSPGPMTLNLAGSNLYVGNRGDATISGFSVANGVLSSLGGSPYAAKYGVGKTLVPEKGGNYLLLTSPSTTDDLTMFGFDTTVGGKLNLSTQVLSGTEVGVSPIIAVTH